MTYIKQLLRLSRRRKQAVVIAVDVALNIFATWLAFTFRLDVWHRPAGNEWIPYGICAVLFLPFFIRLGLYRAIFRYSGTSSITSVGRAVGLYGLSLFAILFFAGIAQVPRSIGISQPLLFFGFTLSSRLVASVLLKRGIAPTLRVHKVLIYGAGEAGAQASASLGLTTSHQVVGFLDDEPAKQGQRIHGFTIFSPLQGREIVKRYGVTDILIAVPSANLTRRRHIVNSLQNLHVRVRTLPGIVDLARGEDPMGEGQELQIIDLLDREPINYSISLDLIEKRVVLITGAGGSIGSELSRQIVGLKPQAIVLVDHSEFNLYTINEELQIIASKLKLDLKVHACLGSVRDEQRMEAIFNQHKPSLVYHAAAYKHVPIVEDNPFEAASNNVLGTLTLAKAAQRHGVERFTLISTDKAVRPTNYMGASKRLAEEIIQAMAAVPNQTTIYSMVRFGNVLGSSGSVVPLFRKQISFGGPITITHPDVVRYFMTIPEAVGLILQASQIAKGGEVFVLDMGQPVKILDLAKKMIRLAGFNERTEENPDGEIDIVIVGLRPGEKLYEELLIGDNSEETINPHILMAHEIFKPWDELFKEIDLLKKAIDEENAELLHRVLPRITA